jgi:hypothetical protein
MSRIGRMRSSPHNYPESSTRSPRLYTEVVMKKTEVKCQTTLVAKATHLGSLVTRD